MKSKIFSKLCFEFLGIITSFENKSEILLTKTKRSLPIE